MPSPPEKSSISMSLTSVPDCPVCLEIPFSKKIYQCQNGHIRCEDCKTRATGNTCPVCRIPIQEDIRNISVENVLKGLQHSSDSPSHLANMVNERRQRRIRLCKQLGFPTCRFETSIPKDFVDHLIHVHGVSETSDKFISVDFCAWSDIPATRLMIFGRKENSQDWLQSNTSFLFVCKQNENGLLVNCICIGRSLEESQSYRTSYYFTSTNVPKCVASWPTLWCSDPAIPGYQMSIWDSAYHVSQRTLRSVQGHDDAVNLLVRIKKPSQ